MLLDQYRTARYQQDTGAVRLDINPISAVLTHVGGGRTVASWRWVF
jgi:hypothetical protein